MISIRPVLFSCIVLSFFSSCDNNPKPRLKLNKEQLIAETCAAFENDVSDDPDSIKLVRIFNQYLSPHLKNISQDSANELSTFLYIRLQKDCLEFKELTDRLNPGNNKGDWRDVDKEPESEISKADYEAFFENRHFKYLESTGDTTLVTLNGNIWEEQFADGSYSRLTLKKTEKGMFSLAFIASNNISRKNLSNPGDKYWYKIIKKEANYYSMFAYPDGAKIKWLFKLYY